MSQHQGRNISSNYCRELIINEADPRPFSTSSRARKPQGPHRSEIYGNAMVHWQALCEVRDGRSRDGCM